MIFNCVPLASSLLSSSVSDSSFWSTEGSTPSPRSTLIPPMIPTSAESPDSPLLKINTHNNQRARCDSAPPTRRNRSPFATQSKVDYRKHTKCASMNQCVCDTVSMVLRGWDIGPKIPIGPSPRPSWNAQSLFFNPADPQGIT